MKLLQLVSYAEKKYNITLERLHNDTMDCSVLCDPSTGKWAALLMRQWDSERGTMTELCDIKCGREVLAELDAPYLSEPFHMKGDKWVGVRIDGDCDCETVFRLFDRALESSKRYGATIVLASELPKPESKRSVETALPVRAAVHVPVRKLIPRKIQEMAMLYEFGDYSMRQRSKNFYTQAKFMENYEDNHPWYGDYHRYFPTYHDLRLAELRGYFTWRTQLRNGDYQPISASLAYIYVYELLNGIGADSPEDSLRKLKEFEIGFLDSEIGDSGMRRNLHRWMAELAIIKNVKPELAARYFDEKEAAQDKALTVLEQPDRYSDGEVFGALCEMTTVRLNKSPVVTKCGGEGTRLFAELWRYMLVNMITESGNFFNMCFGTLRELRWYPLCNAVYWHPEPYADAEYVLNESHSFFCKDGLWYERTYPRVYFNKEMLNDFCHEADRQLRAYLKTGRPLKQRESAAWASTYIGAFIEADRQAKAEAAKPKITIRFSQLEQIRRDASVTRDSLLTEEEMTEAEELMKADEMAKVKEMTDAEGMTRAEEMTDTEKIISAAPDNAHNELSSDLLNGVQLEIMRMLLNGESVRPFIKENHLMPSVLADEINEALFDEIGDTVLECDGENLSLIEDYTEDIKELLGGQYGGE